MRALYGFKQRKWYGLKRGTGPSSDILMVLSSFDGPIDKKYFYDHDVPLDPDPSDHVVELKLVTKKIID
jgi:hypothetical protein